MILKAEGITKRFGGLMALNNVSIEVEEGEIFGVIGPNGAGKTTFLNVLSGVYRPDAGCIWYKGRKITGLPPEALAKLGIGRSFQIPRPFAKMTALENVMVATTFANGLIRDRAKAESRAREVLDFVGFKVSPNTLAGNLNVVQLKRLELARALATGCELLLLDEIAAGLTAAELADLVEIIRRVRETGITVIVVEHVMRVIIELCDRVAVLHFGNKIVEGTVQEVTADRRVVDAYLGESYLR